jgi:hypothetical protein
MQPIAGRSGQGIGDDRFAADKQGDLFKGGPVVDWLKTMED